MMIKCGDERRSHLERQWLCLYLLQGTVNIIHLDNSWVGNCFWIYLETICMKWRYINKGRRNNVDYFGLQVPRHHSARRRPGTRVTNADVGPIIKFIRLKQSFTPANTLTFFTEYPNAEVPLQLRRLWFFCYEENIMSRYCAGRHKCSYQSTICIHG